ncbi:uncharacterized protein LOC144478831 isoform X4 [Augochlora pura]
MDSFDSQDIKNGRMPEQPPPREQKPNVCLLRQWKDMPKHLQFNPHIRTGYRPLMTVRQCLGSLFYLHNETVNIMTHGFAILYMLVTIPQLLPWSTQGAFAEILSWCHLIGAVSPWIGSFIYHLFMNLNYDEVFYRKLLKLDMIGIWLCQSFGDARAFSVGEKIMFRTSFSHENAINGFAVFWNRRGKSGRVAPCYITANIGVATRSMKKDFSRKGSQPIETNYVSGHDISRGSDDRGNAYSREVDSWQAGPGVEFTQLDARAGCFGGVLDARRNDAGSYLDVGCKRMQRDEPGLV